MYISIHKFASIVKSDPIFIDSTFLSHLFQLKLSSRGKKCLKEVHIKNLFYFQKNLNNLSILTRFQKLLFLKFSDNRSLQTRSEKKIQNEEVLCK